MVLEDYEVEGFYEYSFEQSFGVWLNKIDGTAFYGLASVANGSDVWCAAGL